MLECATHAEQRNLARASAREFVPAKAHAAGGRIENTGDQVEHGGFACAVRPNQRNDFAAAKRKVKVVDGYQSAELLGQSFNP
jgi:hypothetical protein